MGSIDLTLSLFGAQTLSMASLQRYLNGPAIARRAALKVIPRFICADGFSVSIQASDFHRCMPMAVEGPYTAVECADLSEPVPELLPYICVEDGIPAEKCSYHRVPVETVIALINAHGGLVI